MRSIPVWIGVVAMILASGCAPGPIVLTPAPSLRPMQSHRFETADEERLLERSADVLVDLGFQIDAADATLGLVVGSKQPISLFVGQQWHNFSKDGHS